MKHTSTSPVALLLVALIFGGCETASTDDDPVHPRAEQAQQVVDALAIAHAAYRSDVEERDIEVQPVGLLLDSWRFIPDRGLAEAMATLPLPHSAPGEKLSHAPWTIEFYKPLHPRQLDPGELLAIIVDSADPLDALTFAVVVGPDGTVAEAHHTGWMNRG